MKQWVDTRRDQLNYLHSNRHRSCHPSRYNRDFDCSICADDVRIRTRERNRQYSSGAVSRVVNACNSSDSNSERSLSGDRDHRSRNQTTHGTSRRNPHRDLTIINGGFSTHDRNKGYHRRQRDASGNSSDAALTPRDGAPDSRSPSGERERRRHHNRLRH